MATITAETTVTKHTAGSQVNKLMTARCRLMIRQPWYGHVSMSMVWIPSEMNWKPEAERTMGVRIVNGGVIQCLYYPPFVDSMSLKELYAVIQHEIEHIVRCHCLRIGNRNPIAWNIACDMTVNGKKKSPRIGYPESGTGQMVVPLKGNIIWIPEDWSEKETAEFFYDKLEKEQLKLNMVICGRCGRPCGGKGKGGKGKGKDKDDKGEGEGQGQGQGKEQGEGGGDGSCPSCGQSGNEYEYGGVRGKMIDDHSVWNQTDVSQDEARQIIRDVVIQATAKAKGDVPGHLQEAIAALAKPVVRWRELLRHYLGRHVGCQRKTYSRRNRRRQVFGMPGISHHAAADVVVVVDTSGSVGNKELQQFFAEIDAISSRAMVNVLQWDHAFQGWNKYRRGDWKKFKVNGRGGTDMAQPMQWLMDKRKVADVVVMLTDGYCNWIDAAKINFPCITVITTADTTQPDYGHVVRMKVHE